LRGVDAGAQGAFKIEIRELSFDAAEWF